METEADLGAASPEPVPVQPAFTSTLLDWYREHPGFHRPRDVASAMGADPQIVASRTRYLWTQGHVNRQPRTVDGRPVRNQSEYGVSP